MPQAAVRSRLTLWQSAEPEFERRRGFDGGNSPRRTRVINHIALLPDSPSDNRIRFAVFGAIYSDPLLGWYAFAGSGGAIHIVVERGNVTLEGEVVLASDTRRIVELVGKVPGVLSISSHLVTGN